MDEKTSAFGSWLRGEIERKGWSLSEFARQAGVGTGLAGNWATGKRRPKPVSCKRIAAALEIAPEVCMYHAGHLEQLPRPEAEYERERALREIHGTVQENLRRFEEVRVDYAQSAVRYFGKVPADSVRWIAANESGEMRDVWNHFLAGRSPASCFTVTASGDCLMRRGIIDGNLVLLERTEGRQPHDGQIVLVRFQDETTLKVWHREGDWIELRNGEGWAIARFSIAAEFEVEGFYVATWREPGT